VLKSIYYVWLPALGGFVLGNYVLPALQQQKPEWFANPWALRVSIILVVMCFLPLGVQALVFLYGIAWQQFGNTVTGFVVVTLIGALVGGLIAGGGYYLFERGKTRIADSHKGAGGPTGPVQVQGSGEVTPPPKSGLSVSGTGTVTPPTGPQNKKPPAKPKSASVGPRFHHPKEVSLKDRTLQLSKEILKYLEDRKDAAPKPSESFDSESLAQDQKRWSEYERDTLDGYNFNFGPRLTYIKEELRAQGVDVTKYLALCGFVNNTIVARQCATNLGAAAEALEGTYAPDKQP
jgi:hypothetical protein